jgi:hypothetical protein
MVERNRRRRDTATQAPDGPRREGNITIVSHDTSADAEDRARDTRRWIKPKHGRGMLRPFEPGNRLGGHKGTRYIETQQLCRQHSLEAVQALIERLKDPDGRIVVVAANSILERAWGKVREAKPEEQQQAHIDLSALSAEEMRIMLALAQSGRLRAIPGDGQSDAAPTIDAKAE